MSDQRKIRLNLDLTNANMELLKNIKERSEAPSLTEVVRKALSLYDLVLAHGEKGGKIVFEDAHGEQERLRIL